MTIDEAVENGISRVRRPMWSNPNAYVRLDLVDGGRGPWLRLYDRTSQEAIGEPTPQVAPCFNDSLTDYEEYTGPIDPVDTRSVSV